MNVYSSSSHTAKNWNNSNVLQGWQDNKPVHPYNIKLLSNLGWISKTFWVKEAWLRCLHNIWFNVYDLKKIKYSDTEQSSDCQGLEMGRNGVTIKSYQEILFWGVRTVLYPNYGRGHTNNHMVKLMELPTKKKKSISLYVNVKCKIKKQNKMLRPMPGLSESETPVMWCH